MTSGFHSSTISGSQQSFLTETAICIVERWNKSVGYRFVPQCNLAQESHTCHFFLPYLQDHGLLRSRPFATVTTWRDKFSSLPALKLVWGEGEGGLRLSSVAVLGSLYSFSRAFKTPCLLGYFNVDVIDSLISAIGFIITPFMVSDRKAWKQRRKEANKV